MTEPTGMVPWAEHQDDAETIEERPTEAGPPVDGPGRRPLLASLRVHDDTHRRPVIPASLRNADQRRGLARWAARYTGYVTAFHAVRAPKYATKTAAWSIVGAGRIAGRQLRWWWTADAVTLMRSAAIADDAGQWLTLHQHARKVRLYRGLVLLAELVGVTAAMVLLVLAGPAWLPAVVAAVVVPALAVAGRPAHKPILDRVSTGPRFVKLTADQVRRALVATGKIKDEAAVRFDRDIGRDGPGWLAQLSLPDGVIATDIMDRREQLAGGLRLPLDQVWPEPVRGEHPGRVNLFVADKPVKSMRQPASPLLAEGTVSDYFNAATLHYGYDVRMRPVTWRLDEANSLFGGVPGSGKTLAARNALLAAVLDPLVIPVWVDLKGTGDGECFQPLCAEGMYVCGADDASLRQALAILDYLMRQAEERPPLVAKYARQGMAETKKVTRRMAEHDERLRPMVVVIDEVQELLTHPEYGKPAVTALTSAVKRLRAQGVHIILATQRIDAQSLPKGISSNVTNRSCLAVPSHIETELVLGTGSYRQGARPTAFVPGEDAGFMVRTGFGPGFQTVRAAYINDRDAAAICQRAAQLRTGQDTPAPVRVQIRNLLEDVRTVWRSGTDALWSEVIVGALREMDPDAYGDLTVEVFGAQMAAAGCPTGDIGRRIDGKQTTRKGVRLPALEAAIGVRQIDD